MSIPACKERLKTQNLHEGDSDCNYVEWSMNMSETKTKEKKGFILRALDTVERVGNGLPNPATIFIILTAAVIVISAICAACGVSVTYDFLDSKTGEINQMSVAVVSLLAPDSIRHMVTTVVSNFTGFFALGTVFTIMIGVGVADGTGFLSALLRKVAASTPKGLVTSVVVFLGIMSNIASSTGYVVLVPLGAILFMAFGRHSIAGLAAAFAGVSGGWSANLLIATNDPMFAGMSTQAAQTLDPNYTVLPVANWFFMIASTFLITAIGTLVTDKLVEPRLTPYVPDASEQVQDIAENEKRGMRFAGITALVYVLLRNYSVISIKKFLRKNIRTCNIYILTVLSLKPTQTSIPGYGRKRLKNPDTACLRRSLPCFRKLILSFNTRG